MKPETSDAIECRVHIDAPPEAVFPYFIDADKMSKWMGSQVVLEPRPGGVYQVQVNERDIARGEYLEVTPPRRVVFTFGWIGSPLPPGASTVEITLEPQASGTLVILRHLNLPEPAREQHVQGWTHYLGRLKVAAVGGDPGPDPFARGM
jgi:uncharacterized protein YndB with AHSA1/START domain